MPLWLDFKTFSTAVSTKRKLKWTNQLHAMSVQFITCAWDRLDNVFLFYHGQRQISAENSCLVFIRRVTALQAWPWSINIHTSLCVVIEGKKKKKNTVNQVHKRKVKEQVVPPGHPKRHCIAILWLCHCSWCSDSDTTMIECETTFYFWFPGLCVE